MTQSAWPNSRGKMGWTQSEEDLLYQQICRARETGQPLKQAFESIATLTGRKPNSIRNYYYAKVKEGLFAPCDARSAFTPFSQEEIDRLLETVLHGQAEGMSVRGITLKMGQGDKKAMLRYQNKYRSMVKHNPDAIYAAIERLKAKGLSSYDPYSQPRVHKAGRKPGSHKKATFDETLIELGAQLKQIEGVDANMLLQQLVRLASLAGQKQA